MQLNTAPMHVALGQDEPYDQILELSALPEGTYQGWYFVADIKKNRETIKRFEHVEVQPQDDGTGLAFFEAQTTNWPVGEKLITDFILYDNQGNYYGRSKALTVEIEKGVTDRDNP